MSSQFWESLRLVLTATVSHFSCVSSLGSPGPLDTLIFYWSEPPLPEIVETAPEDTDLYSCLSSVLAAEKSPLRWNLTFSSPPLLM